MKILRVLLIAVVFAAPVNVRAAVVNEDYRFLETASPGQLIKVGGTTFEPGKSVLAKLYPLGSTVATEVIGNAVQGEASFTLPDKLAPGRYIVDLIYNSAAAERIPGELRVVANAVRPDTAVKPDAAVTLDAGYPTTAYKNAKGSFDFDVIGQNFNKAVPEDNKIYISGRGQIIKEWFADKQQCEASPNSPCLWVESSEKLHVVGYKAESYQGPLTFSVKVGNNQSAEKKLTLSRMSETGVLLWSIGIFLALGYIIYRLVAAGMRDNVIRGKRYSPFWAFFIDKQTNSYSLSKFQFLLFSSVFVFGYLYVFLCRWLVQWQFVLPDVPSSFTGILAISAGTTLASAGATAARGSKGAGPMGPTPADFICSGGQVIPERFQFFVWTLVACLGFLALLISQDPATIEKFPSFPEGLLYVMGVSAGGYLGGKLARPTGPVIRNIAWDKDKRRIIIQGENLSKDGDFFIDSKKLDIQPATLNSLVDPSPQDQKGPDGTFCSELKITIATAAGLDPSLSTGDHAFRIKNKDGQFADAQFTADPPAITEVLDQPTVTEPPSTPEPNKLLATNSARTITVTGRGFREGTLVKWTPPEGEPTESTAKFESSEKLEITLVPGEKRGTGTLVLVTPSGFSAVATVTLV